MLQIGALCYTNIFMHREELKQAIMHHSSWPSDLEQQPIFDIYIGDFITHNKKTKMLFISSEKSKQEMMNNHFKTLYNGTKKSYPNGSMMLFIPFTEGTRHDLNYHQKILFNHNQFSGEEAAFIIGGLRDLQTTITLRNSKIFSLCTFLKGIPATQGMSRHFLFQHVQPSSSGMVKMAIYQKVDHDMVI
jgi:hypothetical protein